LATACHKVARELKPQLTVFGENQVINDSGKPSIEGTGADKLVSVGHVER
jgi:hypothetical protein